MTRWVTPMLTFTCGHCGTLVTGIQSSGETKAIMKVHAEVSPSCASPATEDTASRPLRASSEQENPE